MYRASNKTHKHTHQNVENIVIKTYFKSRRRIGLDPYPQPSSGW